MKSDIVIVGGSAAGIVAGMTARQHNKSSTITLVRKEEKICVPCAIPYIFGTLGSTEKDLISDLILDKNDVRLMIDEVQSIDRDGRRVITSLGNTIDYDKLVLATGSSPINPHIPGITLDNVFVVQKDVDYLNSLIKKLEKMKDVVIIGGGFIGVEFADEFKKRGLNVTIIELLPHCLQLVFDEEFCIRAEKRLTEIGVNVLTKTRAEKILGEQKVTEVELDNGQKLTCDAVLLGIGVVPNTKLAQKAGLEIGEQRGIWVDQYMRTSDENIFAVGDCAEKTSYFTKKPISLRLASIATWEARIAGANLSQLTIKQEGVLGVFSTIIRDLAIGGVGLTEDAAKDAGFNIFLGRTTTVDKHPGSMPNAAQINIKLLFEKETKKIIGGEVSGGATTAEITNILASLITAGLRVEEIATLQVGTQPALTASPIAYPIIRAAEDAMK